MIFQEQRPMTLTMAKIMYELEDPIIHAWILADFNDGRGIVECPLSVGPACWLTENGVKSIIWKADPWVPEKNCFIFGLQVKFVELSDDAFVPIRKWFEAHTSISFRYSINDHSDLQHKEEWTLRI